MSGGIGVDEMIMRVDYREKPEFKTLLKDQIQGIVVVEEDLPVGDIILELDDKYLIERKTARDYVASIGDGRLYRQVRAMSKITGYHLILAVEKSQDISKEMAYRKMPYYRILTTELWMAKTGVHLLKLFRTTDLLYLLNREIKHTGEVEDEEMGSLQLAVQMVNPYRGGNVRAEAVSMLCAVKGVGLKTGMRLLRGRTVLDVLNAIKNGETLGLTRPQLARMKSVSDYKEDEQ